jgi:putative membrane protein
VDIAAYVVVGLVALLHAWFLVLEMFLWTAPGGRAVFGTTQEFAEQSRALAANQGLYSGFLVAGLVWGLVEDSADIVLFFLGCVVVAGVFGAATVSRRILTVQALPAAVGIVLVLLSR